MNRALAIGCGLGAAFLATGIANVLPLLFALDIGSQGVVRGYFGQD